MSSPELADLQPKESEPIESGNMVLEAYQAPQTQGPEAPNKADPLKVSSVTVRGREGLKTTMESAGKFSKLQNLDIGMTDLDNSGLNSIADKFKSLSRLILDSNKITDDGISALSKLPNLKSLDIGENSITDKGMAKIASLRGLEQLDN